MRLINNSMMFLYTFLCPAILHSKEVKSSMKNLESSLKTDIAVPVAGIGLIVAAIFFFMGRQDASQRFSQVIIGLIILACSGGIIAFAMKIGWSMFYAKYDKFLNTKPKVFGVDILSIYFVFILWMILSLLKVTDLIILPACFMVGVLMFYFDKNMPEHFLYFYFTKKKYTLIVMEDL